MTTVQNLMILFLGPWFLALPVLAGKSFDGLTCNSDIAHELMGRKMEENEPVAKIEQRYRDIKLQALGADEPELVHSSHLSITFARK